MGQSAASKLLAVPQQDEICTFIRQKILPAPEPPPDPGNPIDLGTPNAQTPDGSQPTPAESGPTTPRSVLSEQVHTGLTPPQPSAADAPLLQAPAFTTPAIISECGAFSSYARPVEVEYCDAGGDWTVFVRNPNGRIDLLINGQLRLRNLTSVHAEGGFKLHVDGTSCDESSSSAFTSFLVSEELAARGRGRPAPSGRERNPLWRLDRSVEANEDLDDDLSQADAVVRRVTSLFGQPEPLQTASVWPCGEELPQEGGGRTEDEKADMTPEGFRVLWTRQEAMYKDRDHPGRTVTVLTVGSYFYFDSSTCPRFTLSDDPMEVEQWRGGRLLWCGKVIFYEGISGLHGDATGCTAHGCRWPPTKAAAEFQWEVGDTIFVIGHHTDVKTFGGTRYKDNLDSYQVAIGCNPEEVLDCNPEEVADSLTGERPPIPSTYGPGGPDQLQHRNTISSYGSRSSSSGSLDGQEEPAELVASGSVETASASQSMPSMGHLMSGTSQVRQAQLAVLRGKQG